MERPVLVIGAGGRLGRSLVEHFQATGTPVLAWDRTTVDLADGPTLRQCLSEANFHHVILSAALTSLDACEQQPALAHAVNADAPGIIAAAATRRGSRCLYLSTDYVYDGEPPGLKSEEAPLHPLGVYARTKLLGEQNVQAAGPQHLVARTSWIFGPQRPSFVDQILQRAALGQPLQAIANKFSAPSYSNDLAAALAALLHHPQAVGIYNVVNSAGPQVSWHTLAQETLRLAVAHGRLPAAAPVDALQLAEMQEFLAPRPVHTTANNAKLTHLLGTPLRSWEEALESYLLQVHGPGMIPGDSPSSPAS